MTFASKVCTVEKSCQVRRVKAVQDLALRLGHGADDTLSGKLSPSSGEEIARGDNHTRAFVRVRACACSVLLSLFYIFFSLSFLPEISSYSNKFRCNSPLKRHCHGYFDRF